MKHSTTLSLFLTAALFLAVVACDTNSQIRDVVEDVCYQNSSPSLGDAAYFLIGDPGSEIPLVSPPPLKAGDRVTVGVSYLDDDCNLAGGILYYAFDGGAWLENATALRGIDSCSSVEGGELAEFALNLDNLDEGWHDLDISVTDVCNDSSDILSTRFRILPQS